ncbi:uncharacterized protein PHACADRAFT_187590 [Phanerochaete carnosa HHB-10118-sp]|uniref:Uncharacterized protein n=1 Tax=Phanerochaete carnosa (strain HHB-10118-sp) TaxID=650164 RepID=K5UMN8_PHACS|nr:uncharacterized protein PHACADRAFT_187590 [Phanerochaete carnosa HHB-10118-sp]EKM50961.1 hypothetical protein PHACADRAFT_187590 [Phanerochaete carnosa HHB-10118-sp]
MSTPENTTLDAHTGICRHCGISSLPPDVAKDIPSMENSNKTEYSSTILILSSTQWHVSLLVSITLHNFVETLQIKLIWCRMLLLINVAEMIIYQCVSGLAVPEDCSVLKTISKPFTPSDYLAQFLPPILLSRFLLNLRQTSFGANASTDSPAYSRIIGNIGEDFEDTNMVVLNEDAVDGDLESI